MVYKNIVACIYFLLAINVKNASLVLIPGSLQGTMDDIMTIEQKGNFKFEYEQDLSRLDSISRSKDLDSLLKIADEIEKKWSKRKGIYYFLLMEKVCSVLSSVDFNEYDRQIFFAQMYATGALKKADEIPLEIELPLLLYLQENVEYAKGVTIGKEWSKQRSSKAKMWFHAWHRLEKEIDRDFDFNDLPVENVMPPQGVGLPAGVAPEHIKDPKLRAEYEAAIAKNKQKAENYNRQLKLREMDKLFSPKAEQYIISAYLKPPFDLEELRRYLDKYLADKNRKIRIMDAVKQNMSKK